MKRILRLTLLTIVASASALAYANPPARKTRLPKTVQTFLSKHFPGDKIRKVEQSRDYYGIEFEVDLRSGAEADFRENGEWEEVKAARGKAVPSGIIPAAIAKFVTTNFKGQRIVEISRERGGYEITLSNGTELRLTEDARPIPSRRRD